jgi:hypothetical protein
LLDSKQLFMLNISITSLHPQEAFSLRIARRKGGA